MWQAPAGWPWWYTLIWVAAIATLTLARPSRAGVLAAALVAAFGASALVWGNTARGRVILAQRELARLARPDPEMSALLTRFARGIGEDTPSPTRQGLLQAFVASDLAAAGYPTLLAAWDPLAADTLATLQTGVFPIEFEAIRALAVEAVAMGRPRMATIAAWPGVEVALAVPTAQGIITAVVAPRTTLIAADPVARLIGTERGVLADPPYSIRLAASGRNVQGGEHWRRDGYSMRGSLPVEGAMGPARAFVDVELRPLGPLVQRGVLIVLLDLALVGALWMLTVVADGRFGRWVRGRRHRWRRSYRARLSLALFLFFVIPAAAFAIWSYQQLLEDGRQSRILLVRETLRTASRPSTARQWIGEESRRLDVPLLLYSDGVLAAASEPLYETLAPTGLLLRPDVQLALGLGDEIAVSRAESGTAALLFGYRALEAGAGPDLVLAAPARIGDAALDRRRQDLGILVLFATAVGALAALALSGFAARQLATPVGALREAAMAIARGEREPALEGEPPVEFRPVFTAFRRMAADLSASRSDLETAQQRTAAVLRNVASGVVAIAGDGRVTLANPRAEALLGAALPPGTVLAAVDTTGVAAIAHEFIASGRDEHAFELETPDVQLQGRVTRLGTNAAVVTIDDITAMARAQRVLAWGEMARQVAHEIKNPLTPIRLGVQHLRRAHGDARVDFDTVLDQNVTRILEEIDRLDEIARAFSRYGSAPAERTPAEPVDVAQVVRDLVALETMGEAALRFRVDGAGERVQAMAHASELREVLLNIVENARLAEAREVHMTIASDSTAVTIAVRDDGHGIPLDVLPRIFEPRFSTRTSGSGLGLAVSRRMVESWGGEIAVETAAGDGTTVTVTLMPVQA
ncbi:MAG: ATP-binding protein [Gemmatimonadaceae bacterium]|nr:ATP-binding protein [Gemmatimonadaceae bacterium]